jgi:hypothetical protein
MKSLWRDGNARLGLRFRRRSYAYAVSRACTDNAYASSTRGLVPVAMSMQLLQEKGDSSRVSDVAGAARAGFGKREVL